MHSVALRRPVGMSSRLRRAAGEPSVWVAPNNCGVELPVVLDVVSVNERNVMEWAVDAVIDTIDGFPAVVSIQVSSHTGLDLMFLQTHFRWSTPLEVVTVSVPQLLARGIDPFDFDFPVRGFPDAADVGRAPSRELSDASLALRSITQRTRSGDRRFKWRLHQMALPEVVLRCWPLTTPNVQP